MEISLRGVTVLEGGPVATERGFVLHTDDVICDGATMEVDGEIPWRAKFDAEVSEGAVDTANGRVKVLLMKPQTFYNESGRAMSKACTFYKVDSEAVTVLHDEIDLAPGRVRVKRGGGHSGNNGILQQ